MNLLGDVNSSLAIRIPSSPVRQLLLLFVLALPLLSQEQFAYANRGGQPLVLDYHKPASHPPQPVVILIHNGDFTSGGNRSPLMLHLAGRLRAAGLAVFSINYRLAPAHPFPAAVEDVAAAAQWVRAHTRKFRIDSRRIVLAGVGAGGYLATAAAAGGTEAAGVIAIAAWSDFRNQPITDSLRSFLGPVGVEEASPALHLHERLPPFLLLHGDEDASVPASQSVHLQGALHALGIPCSLILLEGGGHDPLTWNGAAIRRDWERELLLWLDRTFAIHRPR